MDPKAGLDAVETKFLCVSTNPVSVPGQANSYPNRANE